MFHCAPLIKFDSFKRIAAIVENRPATPLPLAIWLHLQPDLFSAFLVLKDELTGLLALLVEG
jgi:hypothetical protein